MSEPVSSTAEKYKLLTNQAVEDNCRSTCSVPRQVRRAVLALVRGGPRNISATIAAAGIPGLNYTGGPVDVLAIRPGMKVFQARRLGKSWHSQIVDEPNPPHSARITVVLEWRQEGLYGLGSAQHGEPVPPEPGDLRAIARVVRRLEEETGEDPRIIRLRLEAEMDLFWHGNTELPGHAFRTGHDHLLCTKCKKDTAIIPAPEVRMAICGEHILCHGCEGR